MAGLSLAASLPPSTTPASERGKGKSGRLGWRIRTPTWWGCKGGRERGAGLRQRPPSRCSLRATVNPGGRGRPPSGASEPKARERARKGARSPAARPGAAVSPSAAAAAAAAAPAAPQQSVRLLQQLPRVEGLRGGKARRREGWGGTKAARSLPRGGGQG